jgi:CHAD domain-containing protein
LAYTFDPGKSVQDNVRHIGKSQVDKALAEIDDNALDTHDTVHQIRKRCKKLRALVRLVRPYFDDYSSENAAFRDAARMLSFIRDAEAILETHDDLIAFCAEEIDGSAYDAIRDQLANRKAHVVRERAVEEKIACFRDAMIKARTRINSWEIDGNSFKAIAGGLGKTYKRARNARDKAHVDVTAAHFHQWRKRVKYHWYHARLLSEIWPDLMAAHIDGAKDLSDSLGTHHDLAVLQDTIPSVFDGDPQQAKIYISLAAGRQALLEAQSFNQGRKLLAEKTSALKRRWGAYWDARQAEENRLASPGPRSPAGN